MAKGDIETYYENGQWKSKVEGSARAAHVGGKKKEQRAIGRGMAESRKVEHIIRKKNGKVKEKISYGNDPTPPIG